MSIAAGPLPFRSVSHRLRGVVTAFTLLAQVACTPVQDGAGTVGGSVSPSSSGANPRSVRPFYFEADDGIHGRELWISDGTAGGTRMVKDLTTGGDSWFLSPTLVGDTLLFWARDAEEGVELWRSDGTEAGTVRVSEINPGPGSGVSHLESTSAAALGSTLYFAADDGSTGMELWWSDGSRAGTSLLLDIMPGPSTSCPGDLTQAGGRLWFSADDGRHGWELWTSDGTAAGTVLVRDINQGWGSSVRDPEFVSGPGGKVFFRADDGTSGQELWVTDGTAAGTMRLRDIAPAPGESSFPSQFTFLNGAILFTASDRDRGRGLWRTDGTPEGTVPVAEVAVGPDSSVDRLTRVGDRIIYLAGDALGGYALWKSDGTAPGTAALAELNFRVYVEFTSAGDRFYLSGGPAHLGAELWTVDARDQLTLIKDIDPGPGSSSPHRIGGPADDLVFAATEPEHGTELWRSDGTPEGTVLVKDIQPGPVGSDPRPRADFQGTHFVPVSQVDGRPLLRAATAPDVCR